MTQVFDPHSPGTDERSWSLDWLAALPDLERPQPGDRLLVVAAHPDDETLGAGGLIASAATLGLTVTVVIASDGEASHPDSPTHSPADLARLRRAEVTEAVTGLHPRAELCFLGLPDSQLRRHQDELIRLLGDYGTGATHVITPWSGDRHPDHAACAEAGALVARRAAIAHWQFPIWAWHWARPQSSDLPTGCLRRFALDAAARRAKARAMQVHRSQHTALSARPGDEEILPDHVLAHFRRDCEVFIITEPAAANPSYFDELYSQRRDPWELAERFYERRKRALLLASLPRARFRRAFEPGCAIGLLTEQLADRCAEVIAWDGAPAAVDQAIAQVSSSPRSGKVLIERDRIPQHWPGGQFDLIILSEVGYYCPDQRLLQRRIDLSLAQDGILIGCHWRHDAPDHAVSAETVHALIGRGLHRIASHDEADFLLDVWARDATSVAAAEGIV